jgi:hypothetical protein
MALLGTACSRQDDRANNGQAAVDPSEISGIFAEYRDLGLTTAQPQDATETVCRAAKCIDAMSTSQLTLLQFATSGEAQLYDQTQSGMFQVENIVVEFGPDLSAGRRAQYRNATVRALE